MKVKILLHSNLVRETSRSVENVNITLAHSERQRVTLLPVHSPRDTHTHTLTCDTSDSNKTGNEEKVAPLAARCSPELHSR